MVALPKMEPQTVQEEKYFWLLSKGDMASSHCCGRSRRGDTCNSNVDGCRNACKWNQGHASHKLHWIGCRNLEFSNCTICICLYPIWYNDIPSKKEHKNGKRWKLGDSAKPNFGGCGILDSRENIKVEWVMLSPFLMTITFSLLWILGNSHRFEFYRTLDTLIFIYFERERECVMLFNILNNVIMYTCLDL